MSELGEMYRNGDGVPQDLTLAESWYRRAIATSSEADAYFNLGQLHLGRGELEDAIHLFQHADNLRIGVHRQDHVREAQGAEDPPTIQLATKRQHLT